RSETPISIRASGPMRVEAGIIDPFPMTQSPRAPRPSSSGVPACPTKAPDPMTTRLSTIARRSWAPGPTRVSCMTMESSTTAPGPMWTPGKRTERRTVPSTRAPCETSLWHATACPPTTGDERQRGVVLLVESDQIGVVHLVHEIPGEHEDVARLRVLDHVPVLEQGVRRSPIPVRLALAHVGLQEPDAAIAAIQVPRPADSDVAVERERRVLREDPDAAQARMDAVAEREIDDAVLPPVRERGGGADAAEGAEGVALAPGEHEHEDRRDRGHGREATGLEAVGAGDAMARVEIAVIEERVIEAELVVADPGSRGEVLRLESGAERETAIEPVFQPGMELEGDAAEMRLAGEPLVGESHLHVERGRDEMPPVAEAARLGGAQAQRGRDELARAGVPEDPGRGRVTEGGSQGQTALPDIEEPEIDPEAVGAKTVPEPLPDVLEIPAYREPWADVASIAEKESRVVIAVEDEPALVH